jgi:hypothetical protein
MHSFTLNVITSGRQTVTVSKGAETNRVSVKGIDPEVHYSARTRRSLRRCSRAWRNCWRDKAMTEEMRPSPSGASLRRLEPRHPNDGDTRRSLGTARSGRKKKGPSRRWL